MDVTPISGSTGSFLDIASVGAGPNSATGPPNSIPESFGVAAGVTAGTAEAMAAGQELGQAVQNAQVTDTTTMAQEPPQQAGRRNPLVPSWGYTWEIVHQTQVTPAAKEIDSVSMETESYEGSGGAYTAFPGEEEKKQESKKSFVSSETDTVSLSRNRSQPLFWDGHLPERHSLPDHHVSFEEWKRVNAGVVTSLLPFNVPVH